MGSETERDQTVMDLMRAALELSDPTSTESGKTESRKLLTESLDTYSSLRARLVAKTYRELMLEYPLGSAKRQDYEREYGPIVCGHVRCEGAQECKENWRNIR